MGTILAARQDSCSWVRVEGKGDHRLAPTLKLWAQQELSQAQELLILDFEACDGLDSTFLGTMAALIIEAEQSGKSLQMVRAHNQVMRVIELMGLSQLTTVSADLGEFTQQEEQLCEGLKEFERQRLGVKESTEFSLDAHKQLQATSEQNRLRFADVVKLMEESLREEGQH